MNFCCDMGNTNVSLGLFVGEKLVKCSSVPTRLLRNDITPFGECINNFLTTNLPIKKIGVISVVPEVEKDLLRLLEHEVAIPPWLCNFGELVPIPLLVDSPEEVGADRALGGWYAYEKHSRPLIVVDFGTALTFDVISAAGEFMGGVICPGVQTSFANLSEMAAKLPVIGDFTSVGPLIGKNSIDCMRSAYFQGTAALVNGLVGMIKEEMSEDFLLIYTGGWIRQNLIDELKLEGIYEPHLLLEGLNHLLTKQDILLRKQKI